MEQTLDRVFRRLALLYPPQLILRASRGVASGIRRLRADAVEYLDTALTAEHRELVLPILDESDGAALRLAEARYGLRLLGPRQTLEALLAADDAWLRACALYVAGTRRERSLLPLIESSLSAADVRVRETADWARLAIVAG